MRTDAPWINSGHPDVVAAEQGIRETLPNFPDVLSTIRALRANRRLLVRALSRRLRCAGSFQLDRDGRLRARPAIANPGTAWILVLNAGMVRPQFKIAVDGPTVAESRLTPAAMRDVFLGQVFFTPGDTEPSREATARALGQAVEPADVQWPLSWPVNGR